MKLVSLLTFVLFLQACNIPPSAKQEKTVFDWKGANIYFLLTDRFCNGDKNNDVNFNRTNPTGVLRGFEGGDLKGVINKLEEGYFTDLGINAIWMTPIFEQTHNSVDEGTGNTYGFHGYWTKDWTRLDPNFGSTEDLAKLIKIAHSQGIRILLDAVINHTGPASDIDPAFDKSWVRTDKVCTYENFEATVKCMLTENLPDIRTESKQEVELPQVLIDKWKAEGRYQEELDELTAFFSRTGYAKTPKNYIIKWLTDYIIEFGIDGYRVDTVKHTEETVWNDFKEACDSAFAIWKKNNPEKVLDNNDFYTLGEVYGFSISSALSYDFGDKKINYYEHGFTSLINFEFKYNARESYQELFSKYSDLLNGELKNYSVVNYLSSHDDGTPYDQDRTKWRESAIKLLLSPGTSQVYYGDETNRPMIIKGAQGDANLRSFMNWDDVNKNKEVLSLWQKLGQFRVKHIAIGAGVHKMISENPYVFSRSYEKENYSDNVVVALDVPKGIKTVKVNFPNGTMIKDAFSGRQCVVENSSVTINTDFSILLLEKQ